MNNDPLFSPGDRVMRVALARKDLKLPTNGRPLVPATDFGQLLYVEDFWDDGCGGAVSFLGIEGIFWPQCFRRVEEIRLCINAVKKTKEPQLV